MPLLEDLDVSDEDVVADQLDLAAELVGHQLPAVPIVFGETIFQRHDRILPDPVGPELHHVFAECSLLSDFLKTYFFFVLS